VYVLNTSGVVSTIDTTLHRWAQINVIDASVSQRSKTPLTCSTTGNKNRLYIPGGTQLTILDVSQSTPADSHGRPDRDFPRLRPVRGLQSDPCSLTSTQKLTVAGRRRSAGWKPRLCRCLLRKIRPANLLPAGDGDRRREQHYQELDKRSRGFLPSDAFCSHHPRLFPRDAMAAGGDSSRAYIASCDGGMVNIIDTTSDTYIPEFTCANRCAPGGSAEPAAEIRFFFFCFAGP